MAFSLRVSQFFATMVSAGKISEADLERVRLPENKDKKWRSNRLRKGSAWRTYAREVLRDSGNLYHQGLISRGFVANRDGLFPLVEKGTWSWDGNPTKADKAVAALFGAAMKGEFSAEKSLGYLWKKKELEEEEGEAASPVEDQQVADDFGDEFSKEDAHVDLAVDGDVDLEKIVHEEPVEKEVANEEEPVEEEVAIEEEPVEEENAIVKERPPKRTASQIAEQSFSELYLVENQGCAPPEWKKQRRSGDRPLEFSAHWNTSIICVLMGAVKGSDAHLVWEVTKKEMTGLVGAEVPSERTIQRRRYTFESLNAAHLEEIVRKMKTCFLQFDDAVLHHVGRKATAIVAVSETGQGYAVGLYETRVSKGREMAAQIMAYLRGRPFWSALVEKIVHLVTDSAEAQRVCNEAVIDQLATEGVHIFKLSCQELGKILVGAILKVAHFTQS